MSTTTPPATEGKPGKYPRSAGALIGALLVTVVGVLVLMWVMSLFRHDLDVEYDTVDHLQIVREAQDSGLHPAYPASLPTGWVATGVDVQAGDDPIFEFRLLTQDERFVGIHEEDTSVTDLLNRYVGEDVSAGEDYRSDTSVARDWEAYVDDADGDTAYAAEVGEQTILVYGSAPAEEIQDLIDRLTTDQVD